MQYQKVCVEVYACFSREGGLRPLELVWKDGKRFPIDRVRFSERAPARVGALLPVRYTCIVAGREKFIYFEPEKLRWFVEVPV